MQVAAPLFWEVSYRCWRLSALRAIWETRVNHAPHLALNVAQAYSLRACGRVLFPCTVSARDVSAAVRV